ncbi:hypothetical protein TNCV_3218321 [Trichonephila clavipes]|nr:hypothetical protein TNCV_3218321 [Trichonephila clavipes]
MCTNCSSEPATPAHILECLGLTKQDLAEVPLLVLEFLKVYDVMDLAKDLRAPLAMEGPRIHLLDPVKSSLSGTFRAPGTWTPTPSAQWINLLW